MDITLHDLLDMPGYDPGTDSGRGAWAVRNVTEGTVSAGAGGKPECADHKAMNAVNPARTLWRCLMCGRGCYAERV